MIIDKEGSSYYDLFSNIELIWRKKRKKGKEKKRKEKKRKNI